MTDDEIYANSRVLALREVEDAVIAARAAGCSLSEILDEVKSADEQWVREAAAEMAARNAADAAARNRITKKETK